MLCYSKCCVNCEIIVFLMSPLESNHQLNLRMYTHTLWWEYSVIHVYNMLYTFDYVMNIYLVRSQMIFVQHTIKESTQNKLLSSCTCSFKKI